MAHYYAESRVRLIEALNHLGCFGSGIEIGCGHGHLTRMLSNALCPVVGIDVSKDAIERARVLHPHVAFDEGDITAEDFKAGPRQFIVLAQCLWYLLHRFDVVLANCLNSIPIGGLLVVSQAFLVGEQRYGAEIADGFTGALRLFIASDRLQLIHANYDDGGRLVHRDGLMIFRKVA
jgi:trans-aconitate methyltransferase